MRVLIADDEPIALERLELAVSCVPDAVLVARASSGSEALRLMRSSKPDVAILDIQMPGCSGLDAVGALKRDEHIPEIIFVTAFAQHALDAFKVKAVDYLLKPVSFDDFRDAIRRAKERLEARASDQRFAELMEIVTALRRSQGQAPLEHFQREIWVKNKGEMQRIKADDVLCIKADGDYVTVETRLASYLLSETLKSLEERVDPRQFIRIHRSTLVNTNAVRTLRRRGPRGWTVVLDNSAQLSVGPNYAKDVATRLTRRP